VGTRNSAPAKRLRDPSEGMDLNPLFTSYTAFRPGGSGSSAGGELQLFEQAGIKLVHGWLVDPESPEHSAVTKTEDYDTSVNLVVDADYLTKGKLVAAEADYIGAGPSSSSSAGPSSPTGPSSPGLQLSDQDHQKVRDGTLCRTSLLQYKLTRLQLSPSVPSSTTRLPN
jgi:ubiquitin carboxyl-terminal hydrolase MINDY-1/2